MCMLQAERGPATLSASLSTSAILISLNSAIDITCIHRQLPCSHRRNFPRRISHHQILLHLPFSPLRRRDPTTSASQANSGERCPTTHRPLSVQQVLQASTTSYLALCPLYSNTSSAAPFLARRPKLVAILGFRSNWL